MIQQASINYLAVFAAAIASMVIGFLWYGPLFGKMWMSLMSFDNKKLKEAKKEGMGKIYTLAFLSSLIMSYILAHFVFYTQVKTITDGIILAFWVWLGFFATTQLGMVLWEGKPIKLYFLKTLHDLASLCVMASILTVWV